MWVVCWVWFMCLFLPDGAPFFNYLHDYVRIVWWQSGQTKPPCHCHITTNEQLWAGLVKTLSYVWRMKCATCLDIKPNNNQGAIFKNQSAINMGLVLCIYSTLVLAKYDPFDPMIYDLGWHPANRRPISAREFPKTHKSTPSPNILKWTSSVNPISSSWIP